MRIQPEADDAMHLATARRLQCGDFFTYDKKLRKYSTVTGLRIGPPTNPQGSLI